MLRYTINKSQWAIIKLIIVKRCLRHLESSRMSKLARLKSTSTNRKNPPTRIFWTVAPANGRKRRSLTSSAPTRSQSLVSCRFKSWYSSCSLKSALISVYRVPPRACCTSWQDAQFTGLVSWTLWTVCEQGGLNAAHHSVVLLMRRATRLCSPTSASFSAMHTSWTTRTLRL